MKLLRSCMLVCLTAFGLISLPAQAQNVSGDPLYRADAPKAYSMVGDLLIARPLLIGATAIGAGLFVVSLPFSLLGGGVNEAAEALVIEPGREAFARCLGCTQSGYNRQD